MRKLFFIYFGVFLSIFLSAAPSFLPAQDTGNGDKIEIQSFRYDPSGKLLGYAMHHYDKGKKTETVWYNYKGQGEGHTVYEYDGKGRIVKESFYDIQGGRLRYYSVHEYDGRGLKKKSTDYSDSGDMEGYILYLYDKNGKLTEEQGFDKTKKLKYRVVPVYGDGGKKTDTKVYVPDGSGGERITSTATFQYDSDGNEIKMSVFDGAKKLQWYMVRKWQEAE